MTTFQTLKGKGKHKMGKYKDLGEIQKMKTYAQYLRGTQTEKLDKTHSFPSQPEECLLGTYQWRFWSLH